MDKITMLGTGHAMTFDCFNTCFLYENEHGILLTDTGGGQLLLMQLRKAHCEIGRIRDIFISHRHTDHFTGLLWLFRMVDKLPAKIYADKPLTLYLQPDLMAFVPGLLRSMFPDCMERMEAAAAIRFVPVNDGDTLDILGRSFTFVDLLADDPQYGYVLQLGNGKRFLFHGDTPIVSANYTRFHGMDYFMHEAFELLAFCKPKRPGSRRGHTPVVHAAQAAALLEAGALILVHCNDRDLGNRKQNYITEAQTAFHGPVYVPYDLETIELT